MELTPPNWDNDGVIRAMGLLEQAGWLEQQSVDAVFVGMKLNPHGQQQADAFMRIFRELKCRSLSDLEHVLGLLSWYLNSDDLN